MSSESLITMAGPLGTVILGLGGLGALLALVFTGLSLTMRRVPLAAWLAVPLLVLITGALGTWIQAGVVLEAAPAAGGRLSEVAASGLARSWAADFLSRQLSAWLLIGSAWGAALGAVRVGKYAMWTPFAAIMTLLTAVLGAVALAVYAGYAGVPAPAYSLAVLVLVGGVGLTVAASRRAYHEEAFRVAGLRFTAGVLYFLGVAQGARANLLGARMDIYSAQATVAPDELGALVVTQLDYLAASNTLGWIALVVAAIVAVWSFGIELGDVVQKFTVWDVFAAGALLVLVAGVRVVEITRVDKVQDIALLQPMPQLIAGFGYDLPAASVALHGAFHDAHFPRAGFGDALVYKDGQWKRTWAWTGKGWVEDDTPLEQARLFKGLDVLVAIPSGEPAKPLVEVLEKLGGEAIVLLRAGELDLTLPVEAAHLQGTLLHVKLSTARDFTKELWVDADRYDFYYGPVRLFGEGTEAKDPVRRIAAAYALHEGVGNLQVVVGERTRVSNVAELCVASEVVPEEDGVSLRGGWCALATEPVDDFLAAAAEAVQFPAPDAVRMTTKSKDYGAKFEAPLARELPAFDYCGTRAMDDVEEGQVLRGNLKVVFTIDAKGRASGYAWDEKNIDSRTLRTCVKDRLDKIRFPITEEIEVVADASGKAPEPKPPGAMELVLTWR